jgi:hypothetical protein
MTQVAQHTTIKHAAKDRDAVHEAGSRVVYAGLRTITPFFQALLSDKHRIAGLLGGYVAEAMHGFELDVDEKLEQARRHLEKPAADDFERAYRLALRLVAPAGRASKHGRRTSAVEHRHELAARRIRQIWKKTASYLSRPKLDRMTLKLAERAQQRGRLSFDDSYQLTAGAPHFDAAITRRIERDRKGRAEASKRAEVAEEALLQWDQARLEGAL